ncbi:MAG: RidA family protein [Haloferacaceae archaeon]
MKRVIKTQTAPGSVGAYSQATTNGELVFTAGQVPETMDGDVLNDAPVEEQTRQCLENLKGVLEAQDLTLRDVLKTTVYIVDIRNWERVNEAYSEYFDEEPPARSAVGVTGLWGGIDVEIQAIAATD